MSKIRQDNEYKQFITYLKSQIQSAQIKAAVSVNRELLQLYWQLGEQLVEKQAKAQWGDGLLKQISKDLQAEFPDMKGFSVSNLKYMKQWYLYWQDAFSKSQQLVGQLEQSPIFQIPWGQNLLIYQSKDKTIVEYALKETSQAMGVSEYQLTRQLPKDFQSSLPSIEAIEAEIGGVGDE